LRLIDRLRDRLAPFPFSLACPAEPDAAMDALFRRSFGSPAPREPHHFAARHSGGGTWAYVHYIEAEAGVYLCGGLCVDARVYRRLTTRQRARIARMGSLSRWISDRSIAMLPRKRAVFAYTGDARSQRDAAALGFVAAREPHLLVQWHGEPPQGRAALVDRVVALGRF
jgi:hypothetical protein